ncbi:carboxypeptidase regulatory-like domain-containing protein [Carboxylicivirga sp. M1479]|uniref:carboxypeptidase regulatory-like domain-containing protein n=1 Tax=Carboxylicivirga sp. M1479 TaxID=2594476 RepID=UPI00117737B9|nr:carboxypeptidase regulatory-like domain-containing protein [Carboxylicivirga sp. M1479]TRX72094.1 T9SS type A sorting domain-containing protein [Carboxylicivirga sp. M1479]
MKKKFYVIYALVALLCFSLSSAVAQDIYLISDYDAGANPLVASSGILTDDGGVDGDHSKYQSWTATIKPVVSTDKVKLNFTLADYWASSSIEVFDGLNEGAPLIGKVWTGGPATRAELIAYDKFIASNSEGVLTVKFTADTGGKPGFEAEITNLTPSQDDFKVESLTLGDDITISEEQKTINAVIRNDGTLAQDKNVILSVDNVDIETKATGNLANGEATTISFSWMPSTEKEYEIKVRLADDDDNTNNQLTHIELVYGADNLYENFESAEFPADLWQIEGFGIERFYEEATLNYSCFLREQGSALITPVLDIKTTSKLIFDAKNGMRSVSVFYEFAENDWRRLVIEEPNFPYNAYIRLEVSFIDFETRSLIEGQYRIKFVAQEGGDYYDRIVGPKLFFHDVNMKASDISAPVYGAANAPVNIDVAIRNMGKQDVADAAYTVELYQKGVTEDVLLQTVDGTALTHLSSTTLRLSHTFTTAEKVEVYAKVNIAGDGDNSNNATDVVAIDVFPEGIQEVTVGTGTDENINAPVKSNSEYSIVQMIYGFDKVNVNGTINGVSFFTKFTEEEVATNYIVKIGTTANSTYNFDTPEFIDETAFVQVFNGTLSAEAGTGELFIPFTTPFVYNNTSNLVVSVRREGGAALGTQNFVGTSYAQDGSGDFVINYGDAAAFDYTAVTGTVYNFLPNANFFIQRPMTNVSGTITDGTNGIEGAIVRLAGAETFTSTTDVNGHYSIRVIANEAYELSVTAIGYENIVEPNYQVGGDDIAGANYTMAVVTADISGVITKGGAPIWGATITLVGTTHTYTTDFTGTYTLTGVTMNETYDVSITASGESEYTTQLYVGEVNIERNFDILATNIESTLSAVTIFPNPAKGIVTIENSANCMLRVVNMLGEIVFTQNVTSDRQIIKYGDLVQGIYFFQITDGKGNSAVKRIVHNK